MLIDPTRMDRRLLLLGWLPALVSLIAAMIMGAVLLSWIHHSQTRQDIALLENTFAGVDLDHRDELNRLAKALVDAETVQALRLLDADGKSLVSSGARLKLPIPIDELREHELRKLAPGIFLLGIRASRSGESVIAGLAVRRHDHEHTLWWYKLALAFAVIVALVLAVTFLLRRQIWLALDKAFAPIQERIDAINLGHYHTVHPNAEPSAFSPLADALDRLAEHVAQTQNNLQRSLDQSIEDLRESLDTVEIKNIEIDIARKEAIKANKAKSEFLATTSHELRTPLNGIIGFANLLQKTPLNDAQQEYTDTIEESAKVLLININDLIDYSRLDIGKLNLDYKPLLIRDLIAEAQKFAIANCGSPQVDTLVKISEDTPEKLLGDPMRVRQVYNNILCNALTLCEADRIVTRIETEHHEDNKLTLKITISAGGHHQGNPALNEAQQLLTTPNPGDVKFTGKHQMGLLIARGLVKQMRGHIGATTSENEALFWFTVLLGKPEGEALAHSETPLSENTLILVVDDNPSNRKFVCELLKSLRVEVDTAASGGEAIAKCADRRYSLVFMDIQMPDINGIEATKKIRAAENSKHRVPIVALTAHAVEEDKSSILRAGMDDFLSKPVGELEIREVLDRWTSATLPESQSRVREYPASLDGGLVDRELSLSRARGKQDLAKEMLGFLLASLPEDIAAIERFLDECDQEALHARVHKIHGGACYCGVPSLQTLAKNIDEGLKKESLNSLTQDIGELITLCRTLLNWRASHDLDTFFEYGVNAPKKSNAMN